MLHLARHRAMPAGKWVVKILLMMVSFGVIQIMASAYPALLSAGSVKASWNANTEPDLAGYKLYYGTASGRYTVSINVGKVTQYLVTQLSEAVVFYFVITAYDTAGNESAYSQEVSAKISPVDPNHLGAPQNFVLKQNYPNPFSLTGGSAPGQTKIEYYLPEQHQVELKIHNTLGQVVRALYSGLLPSGNHNLTWDGRDDRGELLPTGKYLCTLEVRDEMTNGELTMSASLNRQTKMITLVK